MKIESQFPLKSYNTFGMDVFAGQFAEVTTLGELTELMKSDQWKKGKVFILGGGSNVLFLSDFEGLVVKNSLFGVEKIAEKGDEVLIRAAGGENWHSFVMHCVDSGLGGIENLALIPGTVGAAPIQNIGAYGVELKDVFEKLEALNLETGELETFTYKECEFGYRESVFKHAKRGRYFIVSVTLKLKKNASAKTDYGNIRETLEAKNISNPTIKDVRDAVIEIRQSKLPNPAEIGNAGSFFKNPEIEEELYQKLVTRFPNIPGYKVSLSKIKVPAAWLIDQAGWKGFREGDIGVHARQALVLVNFGGGTGIAIKSLAERIQESVHTQFGIRLLPEVNFVGA